MRIVAPSAAWFMFVATISAQEPETLRIPPKVTTTQQKSEEKKTSTLTDAMVKVTAPQLEKLFDLKVTKFTPVNADIVVILEFVKDADDISSLEELLQSDASPAFSGPGPRQPLAPQSANSVFAYAFDEDNVVIAKAPVKAVSEITGKQGEAFKVVLSGFGKTTSGSIIRKIDIRTRSPIEVEPRAIGPNVPGAGPGVRPFRGPAFNQAPQPNLPTRIVPVPQAPTTPVVGSRKG